MRAVLASRAQYRFADGDDRTGDVIAPLPVRAVPRDTETGRFLVAAGPRHIDDLEVSAEEAVVVLRAGRARSTRGLRKHPAVARAAAGVAHAAMIAVIGGGVASVWWAAPGATVASAGTSSAIVVADARGISFAQPMLMRTARLQQTTSATRTTGSPRVVAAPTVTVTPTRVSAIVTAALSASASEPSPVSPPVARSGVINLVSLTVPTSRGNAVDLAAAQPAPTVPAAVPVATQSAEISLPSRNPRFAVGVTSQTRARLASARFGDNAVPGVLAPVTRAAPSAGRAARPQRSALGRIQPPSRSPLARPEAPRPSALDPGVRIVPTIPIASNGQPTSDMPRWARKAFGLNR